MNELKSPYDARDAFGIQEGEVYHDFTPFKDGKPGFSIKRMYPDNIPFKSPVTKDGTQDTVAMIRVQFNPKNLSAEELDPSKIPLWIDIVKHSKYQYTHFGYNHKDEDCPTAESLAASLETPEPVNLEFLNNYAFDKTRSEFLDMNGRNVSGQDVLQSVFDQHCNSTRQSRRRVWTTIAHIGIACDTLISCLEAILRVCFRKRFDREQSPLRSFRKEDIVLLEAKSLKILGYETTKNVIVTYAVLVLLVYGVASIASWLMNGEPGSSRLKPLVEIWNHPFLGLCATIVTLSLLEYLGPQLIRHLANLFKRIHQWSRTHSPIYIEVKSKRWNKK